MDNDYYSAVYAWFEKCGVVANVRTHLRQKLVNALNGKRAIREEENGPAGKRKSAKQYVHDMMVAEYLSTHHYAYTLSVFASEAPMLVNFFDSTRADAAKLPEDHVRHALQTLEIPEEKRAEIVEEYLQGDAPLLLSVLARCASHSSGDKENLAAARKTLIRRRNSYQARLKEKEKKLKEQAANAHARIALVDEKLAEARNLMRRVCLKEKELAQERKEEDRRIYRREMELSAKQESLDREAERLRKERDNYRTFENDLTKLREELDKAKKELPSAEQHDRNLSFRDVEAQTEEKSRFLEKLSRDREREELASLVEEQKCRIGELTKRAVHLARQLEQARLTKFPGTRKLQISGETADGTSGILGESSSTEDILQDAKIRLRRLEEESLRADRSYYKCIIATELPP